MSLATCSGRLRRVLLMLMTVLASALFAPGVCSAMQAASGWGAAPGLPTGDPFVLPPGIVLVDDAVRPYDPFECESTDDLAQRGSGEIALCLGLRNLTAMAVQVTLPPGLIFIPEDRGTQNALLVRREVIELHPGETLYVPLYLRCINVSRLPPMPGGPKYRLGPVSDNTALKSVLDRVANREVPMESVGMVLVIGDLQREGRPSDAALRTLDQELATWPPTQ